MSRIHRPSLITSTEGGRRLLFTALIFLIAFVIYAIVADSNLREMEVNGPLYNKVVLNKDLIADILPPPPLCHRILHPCDGTV